MLLFMLSLLLRALPARLCMALGRTLGLVWYYAVPIRRGTALAHVRRVFGQSISKRRAHGIVRASMQHLGMYIVESLRTLGLGPQQSARRVQRVDSERFEALHARGRGVIFVTCHLGQFDLAGISHALAGHRISAVVKRISWGPAERFWTAMRTQAGLQTLPERDAAKGILQRLRRGEAVAMLVDQHLPPHRSMLCRFFGGLAATTPAPVRFAMMTGAAIEPVFMVRAPCGTRHALHFCEELVLEYPDGDREAMVRHNTERLNRVVEAWILAHPEQWWWVHRRWKAEKCPQRWQRTPTKEAQSSA